MPIRTSQNRRRNKKAIEDGQAHRYSFPGPIPPGSNCARHDHKRPADRDNRTNAEETKARAHPNKFRNKRQEISQHQIAHGEKTPELSETIEDQLRMSPVSDGSQSHGHFLHHVPHYEREHHKRNKKSDSISSAVRRIGKHAGRIVLTQKNQHSRPDQKPEQAHTTEFFCATPFPSSAGYFPTVARAVHILVS